MSEPKSFDNITLIGMAGAGKSVIGKELAEEIGFCFLDIDELIEQKENRKLQAIIDEEGDYGFRQIEEKEVSGLDLSGYVISPGGSAILSEKAMARLKEISLVIFLDVSFEVIRERLSDASNRGIVGLKDKSIKEIFDQRQPFYRRHADIAVRPSGESAKETAQMISARLKLVK